jgi:hypothetical protein
MSGRASSGCTNSCSRSRSRSRPRPSACRLCPAALRAVADADAMAARPHSSESPRMRLAPRPSGDEGADAEATAGTGAGAGEKPRSALALPRPASAAAPSPRKSTLAPAAGEAARLLPWLRTEPCACAAASASSVRWRRSAVMAAAGSVSGSATRLWERRRARCSNGEAAEAAGAGVVGESADVETTEAGLDAAPRLSRSAEAGAGAADNGGERAMPAAPSAVPILAPSSEAGRAVSSCG